MTDLPNRRNPTRPIRPAQHRDVSLGVSVAIGSQVYGIEVTLLERPRYDRPRGPR